MARPRGSPRQLEQRRYQALELLDQGYSLNEVARRVGCHASSVMRWGDARRDGGQEALKVVLPPGRPCKLSDAQRQRLVELLLQGAMVQGYRTELWTTRRIADLIEVYFDISYHRDHIRRLMHSLRWSYQKPQRRAVERDEQAIDRFKRETWPEVKKTPQGWVPTSSSSTRADSS